MQKLKHGALAAVIAFVLAAAGLISLPGCSVLSEHDAIVKGFEQPADISQAELFARMMATSDPTGTYRKAKSYIQRQEQEVSRDSGTSYYIIETKFKRPDKFRVTTYHGRKMLTALIYNGSRAWQVDYQHKKYVELSGAALQRAKLFFDMGQPGNQFSAIFPKIKLTEWIEGAKQYYKLVCDAEIKGVSPITIYIGKNNFLTQKLEFTPSFGSGADHYVSTMDKYALYDNVLIASVCTVKFRGTESKYRIMDYKLNVKLNDSDFEPPVWNK